MGIVGTHPALLVRVANKEVSGSETWKSAQRIENKGFADSLFVRKSERRNKIGGRGVRHPAVFARADSSRRNRAKAQSSKGVTGVTVCNCGIQRSCGDGIFVTPTGSGQAAAR